MDCPQQNSKFASRALERIGMIPVRPKVEENAQSHQDDHRDDSETHNPIPPTKVNVELVKEPDCDDDIEITLVSGINQLSFRTHAQQASMDFVLAKFGEFNIKPDRLVFTDPEDKTDVEVHSQLDLIMAIARHLSLKARIEFRPLSSSRLREEDNDVNDNTQQPRTQKRMRMTERFQISKTEPHDQDSHSSSSLPKNSPEEKLTPAQLASSAHTKTEVVEFHPNVQCDDCGCCPIVGMRFKCQTCADYDLCAFCVGQGVGCIGRGEHVPLVLDYAMITSTVNPALP
eukprot:c11265_g1_i2.p1 GENE.c11265_g1_i2~~c11265_g1_i2.p1  ORF type:complete len:295 (+),score=74.42 c11265_g1_i2:30-887(+)